MDIRLRGNDGRAVGVVLFTLCSQCQALGQALVLCRQGRGDSVGCVGLLYALPCGYCLEASMTVPGAGVHVPVGPKRSVLTFWGWIPSSTACVATFSTKSLGPHM